MATPKRPTKQHTILAKHQLDFVSDEEGRRVPRLKWFTENTWRHLPRINVNGKEYPKQGFVRVDPASFFVPEESTTTGDLGKTGDKTGKDGKGGDVAGKSDGPLDLDSTEADIRSGQNVTVPVLLQFIKEKGLVIENADRMPKSELLTKILDSL